MEGFPYPEGTPGFMNSSGGYYHCLNDKQKDSLESLKQMVAKENYNLFDLNPYCLDSSLTLLRYLRANKFDTKKSFAQIKQNVQWRETNKVNELAAMNPDSILGCPMANVTKYFPHWHCGYDKTGRPVLYKQYSKFDCTKLKEFTTLDKLIQYQIWEQEQCAKLQFYNSKKLNKTIETVTAVIDIEGMTVSQASSDFMSTMKALANIGKQHYPDSEGRLFIINTPSMFPMFWRMFKGFFDPAMAAKICICGSRKDWEPALFEFIGKENMPCNYGGDLPELTCNVHPHAESLEALQLSSISLTIGGESFTTVSATETSVES